MEPVLSDNTFIKIAKYLYDNTGITLKSYKKYLVVNRLSKFVGPTKTIKTYEQFYEKLLTDTTGEMFTIFTNALTTNFSFFFREPESFNYLRNFLAKRSDTEEYIRLWSAAASTGEESYSMAITSINAIPNINFKDFKILGTDISQKVLDIATSGTYRTDKIKGHISHSDYKRFFHVTNNQATVKDEVKQLIAFRHFNLLEPKYPFKRRFDAIFLRNVLIYFDDIKKEQIINHVTQYLKPDGILVLGLSESLVGIKHSLRVGKNSIYTYKH